MKLGVSYNMFDGYEMLEASARTIRPSVDYINVVAQRTSNHGVTMSDEQWDDVVTLLRRLTDAGVVSQSVSVDPFMDVAPWQNEMRKRQISYDSCRAAECTHFISMDVDEFYDPIEVNRTKHTIELGGYDGSVCSLVDYYGDMNHHYPKYSGTLVPFIYKIDGDRKFTHMGMRRPDINCDPTRQLPCKNIKIFNPDTEIVMHHMTMVRKSPTEIRCKFENSSARGNIPDEIIDEIVERYTEWFDGDKTYGYHINHDDQMNTRLVPLPLTETTNNWIIGD